MICEVKASRPKQDNQDYTEKPCLEKKSLILSMQILTFYRAHCVCSEDFILIIQ